MATHVLNGRTVMAAFELGPGLHRVGRAPESDIRLTDASVSGLHCEIHVSDDEVRVRDLGSTNGTFIDDRPVKESVLRIEQTLTVGQVEMVLGSEVVEITIPETEHERMAEARFLEDGKPACLHHESVPAAYGCGKCGHTFCGDCVRKVGLQGSDRRQIFCPECSGGCLAIAELARLPEKKLSLLARLTQTIRLRLFR